MVTADTADTRTATAIAALCLVYDVQLDCGGSHWCIYDSDGSRLINMPRSGNDLADLAQLRTALHAAALALAAVLSDGAAQS